MRGTVHSRDEHPFVITSNGIDVFAPRITIQREDRGPGAERCKTGIAKLDDLLGQGIPRGSSLLVAGVAGTGKTVLLLEFLYRGALAGEKGIIFSFEETAERLRATAQGIGWDLDREIDRGMIEIVFIPLPNVMVEAHLLMMRERVEGMNARRVAIDSVSVFLYKVNDPRAAREKIFQLASIIQNTQAVGFFAADIPYGSKQLSRFGVEETVVDGVLLLSSTEEELERQRYLEVYKLRNTAHLKGRHAMTVGPGGITISPRYRLEPPIPQPPPPLETSRRLTSGVPGLDSLLGGGLLERSITLVSGSAGVGKTTLALQFIVEGARRKEPGLFVTLEEGPPQLLRTAGALGLEDVADNGMVEARYLSREDMRASQVLEALDDAMRLQKTRRLVLDGIGQMGTSGAPLQDLLRLLQALAARAKSRGVTGLFTLDSNAMHCDEPVAEHGYAPLADNLLLLRYARAAGELRPTLSVVKTRGSANDRSTHYVTIAKGGLRVGDRVNGRSGPPRESRRAGPRTE
jgi:circadian clock protein KaiC